MTQTIPSTTTEAPTAGVEKIWAHSGDSHAMEPADLWTSRLPKYLADRAPRQRTVLLFEHLLMAAACFLFGAMRTFPGMLAAATPAVVFTKLRRFISMVLLLVSQRPCGALLHLKVWHLAASDASPIIG